MRRRSASEQSARSYGRLRLSVVVLALAAHIGCHSRPEPEVSSGAPDQALRAQRIAAAAKLVTDLKADPRADRARVASALLSLGNVAANNGELETARKAFVELVADFRDYPKVASKAQYDLAATYHRYGLLDLAELAYIDLLKNPHELYKHHVSRVLAETYLERGDAQSAQQYFSMSRDKYPFRSFCGNALAANVIDEAVFQSRIHEVAGEPELAIRALLPYVLPNVAASNEELVDRVVELLEKAYLPDELSSIFERSLAEVQPDRRDDHGRFVLNLLGVEIPFSCHEFLFKRREFLGIFRFDVELGRTAKNLRSCLREERIFQEML